MTKKKKKIHCTKIANERDVITIKIMEIKVFLYTTNHVGNKENTSNSLNAKRLTPRHIISKWIKHNKEKCILLTAAFSSGTMESRRQWDKIFKMMKEKDCQPRILYSTNLFFKIESIKYSLII